MELAKAAVTTSQDGYGGDKEYVVACKNRPFTVLVSNNFPTPDVNFIDHKLVSSKYHSTFSKESLSTTTTIYSTSKQCRTIPNDHTVYRDTRKSICTKSHHSNHLQIVECSTSWSW